MVVNGFDLPVAFVELCEAIERGEAPDEWVLKENVDAYGRPWEVADLRIQALDQEALQSTTNWIAEAFLHEGRFHQPSWEADQPGFIEDFTGVANFVGFGDSTSGNTYAFDFGTDSREPSVVHWKGYWRRAAPNFAAFMALFTDRVFGPYWNDDDELVPRDPCDLLAWKVARYVLASRESVRRLFDDFAEHYAACDEDERQDAEDEVRGELESRGMTDEQRQRLNEVWERLRANLPS